MDTTVITDRITIDWQLSHGWTPRQILYAHYDSHLASSNHHREARDAIALMKPKFLLDLANATGKSLTSVILLLKDSKVVRFFKSIRWNFKNLFKMLKNGHRAMKELSKALREYAAQSGIGRWTAKQLDSQRLRDIDAWLSNHPKTRRITGVAVGAMLVYIWFNMSFVGSPGFDFDMSTMLGAIAGNFSLENIFSGPGGAAMLVAFLIGAVTGITFPWPGPATVKFIASESFFKFFVSCSGKLLFRFFYLFNFALFASDFFLFLFLNSFLFVCLPDEYGIVNLSGFKFRFQ